MGKIGGVSGGIMTGAAGVVEFVNSGGGLGGGGGSVPKEQQLPIA